MSREVIIPPFAPDEPEPVPTWEKVTGQVCHTALFDLFNNGTITTVHQLPSNDLKCSSG